MNKPAPQQIEVQIMGQSYLLTCPEGGESSLLDAVERVNSAMCRIRDVGKVKARDRIAVLAALNLAFDLSQKQAQGATGSLTPSEPAPLNDGPATVSTHNADPTTHTRVDDLIRRLDHTLGSDGQLL